MRLPFRRTQKPVAPRVYEPGADSPYVPREGVWMRWPDDVPHGVALCKMCGELSANPVVVHINERDLGAYHHEGCGAKLVAQLRRERESA